MAGLIHVIDDDDAVRESLGFLLETSGWQVKLWPSAQAFLEAEPDPHEGCVITDVRMPGLSGIDLAERLSREACAPPVIIITGHADVPLAVQAMKAGAVDFIEKPFEETSILSAVRAAFDRVAESDAPSEGTGEVGQRIASLSARERQVLEGLVAGKANKIVANDLGISPRTVEVYRANVMTKMRASSLSELVRMAILADRGG
ncbi:MAG TPA: response regulator FixJ [Caulobacteraceae bacterium]|jgi:two-component system response regulator FixJ|nr:response regulator FixJ [Caulobacteraceae bacterium]